MMQRREGAEGRRGIKYIKKHDEKGDDTDNEEQRKHAQRGGRMEGN